MLKFDGKYLTDGSRKVARVEGDKIFEGHNMSKCLVNIRKDRVYEGTNASKCLANVRNGKIYEGTNASKCLATTSDIKKKINGLGEMSLVALWIACVR